MSGSTPAELQMYALRLALHAARGPFTPRRQDGVREFIDREGIEAGVELVMAATTVLGTVLNFIATLSSQPTEDLVVPLIAQLEHANLRDPE